MLTVFDNILDILVTTRFPETGPTHFWRSAKITEKQ